ncbi:MAG: NmrA family NAD(P)-binding protein [Pseudonocardia sp.]|uniref:SDR family oxidoreductase n=1 Tax=unclassified Pseudonocardia TaxID=2619320 RepID=UPI00086E1F66|nr:MULTISPECIES: NmrA family NAD(P)-binding protein [unclassified Pseudonocardia]MBN9113299.1 NmrA family NAD(P)-binding protein [Pseudonocardia sp.]ODU26562.1 MAG: hypothetical protein ABS80_06725 [Pseudonocardia sp. SCN 72-51]ODV01173.1 MAG: hypothetical protein ABT15_28085 [Pseudonocardia sp. SCN 73-27]
MILVTAAGGMTGLAVTAALRRRGLPVRALVRGRRAAADLAALGAEVVVGSLRDDDVTAAALRGCDAVYLIWPNFDADEFAGATRLARRACEAGVERLVYHSVLRPQLERMPHHWEKLRVEEFLDTLDVDHRVVQPCAYLDNLGGQLDAVRRTGRFTSPWGVEARLSYVDLRDVADAAAVVLTTDGLDGGTFELCGPQGLDADDVATTLARRLGRAVRAVDAPPGAAVDYAGRCLALMCDHYREFGFTGSPFVLEALLGRPACTLDDYLASLADRAG